jgi:hypothetical protein
MRRLLLPILALIAFAACHPQQAGDLREMPRSGRWPKVERLHKQHEPACQYSGTCVCPLHMNVHHVKPFRLFPALELIDANLITLCTCPVGCPHCKCQGGQTGKGDCHLYCGHKPHGETASFAKWNPQVREDCEAHRKELAK